MDPRVSICIPSYNSARHIYRALESATHQTYGNIEIVVTDNASTDNTAEIVQKYVARDPRVKFFQNEKNIGSGNNFLKCFEYAKGEFVQPLGSDDWLSKNYIEEGIKVFAEHPDAAAVLANIVALSLNKETNTFSFLDDLTIGSGRYSAEWFFKGMYKGYAPTGFISLLRRRDAIDALRVVLGDPINLLERGARREPMDMPIFLEVLAGYKYFIVTKEAAYIKTVHGDDAVGLQGEFRSPEGRVRYAAATRRAYESFFKKHNLVRHYNQLRFWGGLSIIANAPKALLKEGVSEAGGSYRAALRDFFTDYSKAKKWFIILNTPLYIVWRILKRILGWFGHRSHFSQNPNHFLNKKGEFTIL